MTNHKLQLFLNAFLCSCRVSIKIALSTCTHVKTQELDQQFYRKLSTYFIFCLGWAVLTTICHEVFFTQYVMKFREKNLQAISLSKGNINQEKLKVVPFIGYGDNSYTQISPLFKLMLLLGI